MNNRLKRGLRIILLGCFMLIAAGGVSTFAERGEGNFHEGGRNHAGMRSGGFRGERFEHHRFNRGEAGEHFRGHERPFNRHGHYGGGFFIGPDWFWGPTVVIGGIPYYYDGGQYYTPEGDNLVAVAPPENNAAPSVSQEPVAPTQPVAPTEPIQPAQKTPEQVKPAIVTQPGDTVVNVPNSAGGTTSVILTRKDNGYVGPDGEFYAKLPTPSQLTDLYGK